MGSHVQGNLKERDMALLSYVLAGIVMFGLATLLSTGCGKMARACLREGKRNVEKMWW